MKNKIKKLLASILFTVFSIINLVTLAFAVPDQSKVESVASDAITLFFGCLGGFCVIMGGFEFITAFLSYRESQDEGGSGEAASRVGKKVLSGVFCVIGAVVSFVILGYTLSLFDLG